MLVVGTWYIVMDWLEMRRNKRKMSVNDVKKNTLDTHILHLVIKF